MVLVEHIDTSKCVIDIVVEVVIVVVVVEMARFKKLWWWCLVGGRSRWGSGYEDGVRR